MNIDNTFILKIYNKEQKERETQLKKVLSFWSFSFFIGVLSGYILGFFR